MKKALAIANGVALLVTIAINFLSNTGVFAQETTASISAKYPTLFTPAGYAFTIWIVIYLGLLGFVIYQGRTLTDNMEASVTVMGVGWWFVLSCVCNCAWILAWVHGSIGLSVVIMVVLLFSLLKIVWRTDMEMTDPPLRTIAGVWWPFCLYSGWITAALFADLSAWLLKTEWRPYMEHPEGWTFGMIVAAAAAYLWMTWKRNMREYGFVGVWALVAIGVKDWGSAREVALAAFVVAGVLAVSSSWHGYRNREFSPWRKR
jgi:hypothetical protein